MLAYACYPTRLLGGSRAEASRAGFTVGFNLSGWSGGYKFIWLLLTDPTVGRVGLLKGQPQLGTWITYNGQVLLGCQAGLTPLGWISQLDYLLEVGISSPFIGDLGQDIHHSKETVNAVLTIYAPATDGPKDSKLLWSGNAEFVKLLQRCIVRSTS